MAFKEYKKQDLANYSGRPAASYMPFAEASAVPQAIMLFKLGTCLIGPEDLTPDQNKLVDFAILAMADYIYLSQPFAAALASPFTSESIGSYSYGKTASAVQSGEHTNVMWFNTAVDQLSVCGKLDSGIMFGGVENFEHTGVLVEGSIGNNRRFLTPGEIEASRVWGYDPRFW